MRHRNRFDQCGYCPHKEILEVMRGPVCGLGNQRVRGQNADLLKSSARNSVLETPIGHHTDETLHLRRHCFHLRAEAFAAAGRLSFQALPLAWCLGWERSDRTNPVQVGDGTPWHESGLHSRVFARWLRGLLDRKRSTRGHRFLSVNALVLLERSVRSIRPETQWRLFAMFSHRSRPLGTSTSHPAGADNADGVISDEVPTHHLVG